MLLPDLLQKWLPEKHQIKYPIVVCGRAAEQSALVHWVRDHDKFIVRSSQQTEAWDDPILTTDDSSLLFVLSTSDPSVEESILLLHRCVRLLYEHGGRAVFLVITQDDLDIPQRTRWVADLTARLEMEMSRYQDDFPWWILDPVTMHGADSGAARALLLGSMAELLRGTTPVRPSGWETRVALSDGIPGWNPPDNVGNIPGDATNMANWWNNFLTASIRPWTHLDYLRAVFLMLMQPENRRKGLLELAADFAAKLFAFKQRQVPFAVQPESRTLTVFWVYHVDLAIKSSQAQTGLSVNEFDKIVKHMPELLFEGLPTLYYSSDMLRSRYAKDYWMLPDLRALTELPAVPDCNLGRRLMAKQNGDPERILRLAFTIVQQSMEPRVSRQRSWFINLGFASLQQQTIRLRTLDPSIPPYSLTHAYFFVRLVSVAFSILSCPDPRMTREAHLCYPAFRDYFHITPTAWMKYYSRKTWFSLEARVEFVPPDLRPFEAELPPPHRAPEGEFTCSEKFNMPTDSSLGGRTLTEDKLDMAEDEPDTSEDLGIKVELDQPKGFELYYHHALIPELPSTEILQLRLSILLEEAKVLSDPVLATDISNREYSDAKTHAALIFYLFQNLAQPGSVATSQAKMDSLATYSKSEISFWTDQVLDAISSTTLPTSTLAPGQTLYGISFRAQHRDEHGKWHRYHNCPCHVDVEMVPLTGPSPVEYPHNYPYDHPPQHVHMCICHKGEELDHDAFARLCARQYELTEEWEKQMAGIRERPASLSGNAWEDFMRFNPHLAWRWLYLVEKLRGRDGVFLRVVMKTGVNQYASEQNATWKFNRRLSDDLAGCSDI
ncbi:hypothetical protein QBC47DRAFT_444713 [Echria macrotheca]|uniref:Uncharacterized protein n=1 Tax=Echria macrotheca TaxID=438768 RepID=A0AAJ0BFL8_9PEZI|nr:hypothetical protein QBC47DRAFT_444713 [Echria macrotheca]